LVPGMVMAWVVMASLNMTCIQLSSATLPGKVRRRTAPGHGAVPSLYA